MNNFIKLTLRSKKGYHPSDPEANATTFVNADRIDYYYDDNANDGYESVICINGKEFRCRQNAAEIAERILLVEIADNLA